MDLLHAVTLPSAHGPRAPTGVPCPAGGPRPVPSPCRSLLQGRFGCFKAVLRAQQQSEMFHTAEL